LNGRISEIVEQIRFGFAAELESTLRNDLKIYNNSIPPRAPEHQMPIQALKNWHDKSRNDSLSASTTKLVLTPGGAPESIPTSSKSVGALSTIPGVYTIIAEPSQPSIHTHNPNRKRLTTQYPSQKTTLYA
jgi:hypothetical protein